MSSRVIALRAGFAVAFVTAAWACEPGSEAPTQVPLADAGDILEQAYCERMLDCQCDRGRRFDTIADCRSWIDEQIAQLESEANGAGLTYDPTCIGLTVDRLDALACAPTFDSDDDDECVRPCYPLHGEVLAGQPCDRSSDYSNCAQGLDCQVDECDDEGNCVGRCTDPCFGTCGRDCGEDAQCDNDSGNCKPRPGLGDECFSNDCASGFVCEYDDIGDGRCIRVPELGDDCTTTGTCADGLRCEFDNMTGEGTCIGPSELGEPCTGHSQCESGFCPAGFCDALPGEGDSCEGTFACSKGLDCDFDTNVCVPGDAIVCELYFDID